MRQLVRWSLCILSVACLSAQALAQLPVPPVYVVAHRCNATDMAVVRDHGVNAIEADFRYGGTKNTGWYLAHDNVLASSPSLSEWLDAVSAEVTRAGSPLALVYVDIKTPDAPLDQLFDSLRAKLPTTYLVFDIGLVSSGKYLGKIKSRILHDPRSVAAMGFDDSPSDVAKYFKSNGYPNHKYWYEIGLAAGFTWSETEQTWAKQTITARNKGDAPKVAIWTFERESTVKEWLERGVDAILVNSSKAYGRTTAFATDADVHVKNAQQLRKYATPNDNALLSPPAPPRDEVGHSAHLVNGANGRNVILVEKAESGLFRDSLNGKWYEKNPGDANQTEWVELGRDEWSVYVQNGKRFLVFDLYQMVVQSASSDKFDSVQTVTKIAKAYAPTTVTAMDKSSSGMATGQFRQINDSAKWQEVSLSGERRDWLEVERDAYSVLLQDGNWTIVLDTHTGKAYYSNGGFKRDNPTSTLSNFTRGVPWQTAQCPK